MILILHIIAALSSLVWTGYAFLRPSKTKLNGSYGLVAATLTSGTFLVVSTHSPILQSCVTGLIYLGIAFAGIIGTQNKLSTAKQSK